MGKNILKRVAGILVIPVVCFIAANILCAAFNTGLFINGLSVSTFTYGLAYLSLVAFAVSINLHSGRFDFSVSSIIILSSTVVIMLACAGVDNMALLLLAGVGTRRGGRRASGGLYLARGCRHDHLPGCGRCWRQSPTSSPVAARATA